MDWFLYDNGLHHESVKEVCIVKWELILHFAFVMLTLNIYLSTCICYNVLIFKRNNYKNTYLQSFLFPGHF